MPDEKFNEGMHEATKEYLKSREPGFKPEFEGKSIDDVPTTEETPKAKPRILTPDLTGKEV